MPDLALRHTLEVHRLRSGPYLRIRSPSTLPESSSTPTHNLALAHELCVELAAVERKVDVKVDAVEGALGRVHSFKVLLEVLAGKVRRQSHDFFDAYTAAY